MDTIEALALQEIITSAYSAFLELNKVSLIPSLILLLKKISPDLNAALGFSILPKPGCQLKEESKKIFIDYVSRYQLTNTLNPDDLNNLIQEIEKEHGSSTIFPSYLFDAFRLEKHIYEYMKLEMKKEDSEKFLKHFSIQIKSNTEFSRWCYESLRGSIYYLCTIIDYSKIEKTSRDTYFQHLENPKKKKEFAKAIAKGYIDEMSIEQNQLDVYSENAKVLSSDISSICLPALALLGIKIEVNFDDIRKNIEFFDRELQKIVAMKDEIDKRYQVARLEGHRRIDEGCASVVTPGIVISFNTGPIPY